MCDIFLLTLHSTFDSPGPSRSVFLSDTVGRFREGTWKWFTIVFFNSCSFLFSKILSLGDPVPFYVFSLRGCESQNRFPLHTGRYWRPPLLVTLPREIPGGTVRTTPSVSSFYFSFGGRWEVIHFLLTDGPLRFLQLFAVGLLVHKTSRKTSDFYTVLLTLFEKSRGRDHFPDETRKGV